MRTLPIEVNGDGVHAIETPDRISTDGPFEIELTNLGQDVHVHLNVGGDLSRIASLAATNHFVEGASSRVVHVDVDPNRPNEPVHGTLKVVTGHGANTVYVRVAVDPPPKEAQSVVVDESLSKPPRREPEPTAVERLAERLDATTGRAAGPSLFAFLAAAVALAIGVTVGSPTVFAGVGVVFAAALVALFYVRR